jgi:hypothetical protein
MGTPTFKFALKLVDAVLESAPCDCLYTKSP